jgi:hypothetical protein
LISKARLFVNGRQLDSEGRQEQGIGIRNSWDCMVGICAGLEWLIPHIELDHGILCLHYCAPVLLGIGKKAPPLKIGPGAPHFIVVIELYYFPSLKAKI